MSEASERLRLVPITRAEAKVFVAKHHRHHRPSLGDVFSIACAAGDQIHAYPLDTQDHKR